MDAAVYAANGVRGVGGSGLRGALGSVLRSHWVRKATVAIWMNVLIAAVASGTVVLAHVVPDGRLPASRDWAVGALKLFAVWVLAFLPGWLYVRFLGLRAGALWCEYVLNLHRLGWDDPERLPAPPNGHAAPADQQLRTARPAAGPTIYRLKFDAYYGRRVSEAVGGDKEDGDFVVSVETLFPVFLCTTVLTVGWCAVLWDTSWVVAASGPWDAMIFGFLGAYSFALGMLVRRFFQSDLRPSAYAAVVLRIILVLLTVTVVHQLLLLVTTDVATLAETEMVTAFVIGFFPLVGLQALQRVASKSLRVVVPQMSPDYPLDQLDGLNVWYEARLTEEGVEDMQNLTTMNLVDVVLHTRVPVGRLVDWVDQAFLLVHLEPVERRELARARRGRGRRERHGGVTTRMALRRAGIRTATDLLKVVAADGSADARLAACGLDVDRVRLVADVLRGEPGLAPLWNWQQGGVTVKARP